MMTVLGVGSLALHPTLWSLLNTFHTKRYNGFAEFSDTSLWKNTNKISILASSWHWTYFLMFFMLALEPVHYRAILHFCIKNQNQQENFSKGENQ